MDRREACKTLVAGAVLGGISEAKPLEPKQPDKYSGPEPTAGEYPSQQETYPQTIDARMTIGEALSSMHSQVSRLSIEVRRLRMIIEYFNTHTHPPVYVYGYWPPQEPVTPADWKTYHMTYDTTTTAQASDFPGTFNT